MGYAAAARKRGVTIHEQRPVTAIVRHAGRVAGVETTSGPIEAPIVVNAAGAFAGQVGEMAGVDVPVRPFRRQLFTTLPVPAFTPEPPLTIDYHRNWYFRGELGGCLFSGPKDEESTFNTNVDWDHLARAWSRPWCGCRCWRRRDPSGVGGAVRDLARQQRDPRPGARPGRLLRGGRP